MIPGKKYTYDDFLRIAWRRKWIIVVPFLVASIGTYVGVKRLPNKYRSQTTILVVPQRVPEKFVSATVTAPIGDRVRSISEQILSRSRLEKIMLDFDLYADARKRLPMEDVVERMRSDIGVETVKVDSFTVSYTCGDAIVAKRITERLASMFIDENLRDRVVLADGTSQFLESQLDDARQRLIEHENKLKTYRERYAGELPTQLDTNMRVVQSSENQVQALNESINRDRDRKLLQERLLADLEATESLTAPSPATGVVTTSALAEQIQTARTTYEELQLRLKPDHPDIVRARRALEELERKEETLASKPRPATDVPVTRLTPAEAAQRNRIREIRLEIQNLDRQISEKQAEQQRLGEVIATYQHRIAAVPKHESELTELMRDYDTLQKTYTSLLARKEDSKTAADLERRQIGEQFKILDPAREPEKPISPKRAQLDAIGAIMGLFLGLGVTVLLEYLDSSLKTEDDVVQALALPVLAMIPMMTTPIEDQRRQKHRLLLLSCVAMGVVVMSAFVAWKLDIIQWVR
jgi:polysaccharide chain length determinant protein (PEP-CTERM system associated)